MEKINEALREIDFVIQQHLVNEIKNLDREYNVDSVMSSITTGDVYKKSFDDILEFERESLTLNILKNLGFANVYLGNAVDTFSRGVSDNYKIFSEKFGIWFRRTAFNDTIHNNPMTFQGNDEIMIDGIHDCYEKSNDNINVIKSTKRKKGKIEIFVTKNLERKLLNSVDNAFYGTNVNKNTDKPIVDTVKEEFYNSLVSYINGISSERSKTFKTALESIQNTLDKQANDLNKSNSEKEILTENRMITKVELEFLKHESQEVMKSIENIYL